MLCDTHRHTKILLYKRKEIHSLHTNIPTTIYTLIYKEYIRYIKYCTLSFSVFISVHTYILYVYIAIFLLFYFFGIYRTTLIKKENLLYQFLFSCTLLCWLLIVYCCFFKHVLVFIYIYYCYLLAPLYIHYTTHTHTRIHFAPFSLSLSLSVSCNSCACCACHTHTLCVFSFSLSLSLPTVGLAAREATACGAANGGARTGSWGCTESGAAAAEEHQWGNYLHRYNVHAAALCGSQSPISIAAHKPHQQSHHNNNHKGVNNNHSKTTATTTDAATTTTTTTINLAPFR